MQQKSVFTLIRETLTGLIKFFIPVSIIGGIAYGMWYFLPIISPESALICSIAVSAAALIVAFGLFHADYDIYFAYGAGLGGITLLYASVYYVYVRYALLAPNTLFWTLSAIGLAAGYVAVRFRGWLLAVLGVAMGIMTPSFVLGTLTRYFVAWYFVIFLFVVMAVAYYRKWFELAILAFLGYLLYNPFLFSYTDLEGTKGFLTVYQVLELMVAIFLIYTAIPWLYSLCCPKKRIFEAISLALGGAYTVAIIHFVIDTQLSFVAQLPFFIRYFVSKGVPVMNDVYMYIFVIYGGIYLGLFLVLFLINRQAKVTLGALACLIIICATGIMYTHAKATGLLPTVIRVKKIVEQAVKHGFDTTGKAGHSP